MSVEKNITMRQFNGVDYDTLYPKTKIEQVEGAYTQQQILADSTKTLYGLESTATPDDIFAKLALPANYYGFKILVLSPTGEPVPNCLLPDVFVDMHGNTGVKTGADGTVYCGSATQSVTFKLGGNYFGVANIDYTITANTSTPFTPVTINLLNYGDLTSMTLVTTSYSLSLLGNVDSIDLCAVGGGGGGGQYNYSTSKNYGGGGGGYATNLLNYSLINHKVISFVIGSGGNAGAPGTDGGETSVLIDGSVVVSANGGQSGQYNSGGTGNGNGGFESAGGDGTVRVFNDSSLPLPGGGGGHGKETNLGGADFGGHGGTSNNQASAGSGPGGGGGGSYGNVPGRPGYQGAVYLRVRYKQ